MASDADLLAYLLRGLDDAESTQVEEALEAHSVARQRLVAWRRFLRPLAADVEPPAPPPDLYMRTLRKLAALRSRKAPPRTAGEPPSLTPAWTAREPGPQRSRWRRADVFVAAAVLFVIGLLLPYGLLYLRREQAITACADNLRRLHMAFRDYEARHEGFPPPIPLSEPFNVAGIYAVKLKTEGTWPTGASVNCPANVPLDQAVPPPCEDDLRQKLASGDQTWVRTVGGCYAYSLGYWTRRGSEYTVEQVHLGLDPQANVPLLADRPARPKETGYTPTSNSPNHSYRGQNVLFLDGSVRFLRTRGLPSDDDIFLNRHRELAPGLDATDAVLAPSETRLVPKMPRVED